MQLNKIVARARNFRPATVQKWPEEKIVKAIRHVPLHNPQVASQLLTCHHVPGQLAMVTAFLDALGVKHDQGRVDSLAAVDAEDKVVQNAIRGMVKKNEPQACAIYLLALQFFGAPAGGDARRGATVPGHWPESTPPTLPPPPPQTSDPLPGSVRPR